MQGLCVPRKGVRRHAHFREELQASAWRASLKAFLSDSLRSGPLPPEWHSAGRPEAPQVLVCRWEEVSSLRVFFLSLSLCMCWGEVPRQVLFRKVSVLFSLSFHFFLPLSEPQVSLSRCSLYHSLTHISTKEEARNKSELLVQECDYSK